MSGAPGLPAAEPCLLHLGLRGWGWGARPVLRKKKVENPGSRKRYPTLPLQKYISAAVYTGNTAKGGVNIDLKNVVFRALSEKRACIYGHFHLLLSVCMCVLFSLQRSAGKPELGMVRVCSVL